MTDESRPTSAGDSTSPGRGSISARLLQAEYVGPLPPASEFERYDQAMPGAAERILKLAENEQRHRHALELHQIQAWASDQQASRRQVRRGQYFGLTVSVTAVLAGSALAAFGDNVVGAIVGGIIGSGGLASIIIAFTVPQRTSERDE